MVGTMAGREDKVMTVWWVILFSLVCLFHGNFTGAEGKGGREKRSSASAITVPSLKAVYGVPRYSPLSLDMPDIACVLDDTRDTLLTDLVPPDLPNPRFGGRFDWMQTVEWDDSKKGEAARGAVCSVADAPLYPVAFPLLSWKAHLVPEHLSYTISAGEDLHARLRNAKPHGKVWWQKEPIQPGGWKQATLSDKAELVIPAAMLTGSGFYSFANESDVSDTSVLGTLSLQIRDCPAQRYGDDCQGWCPDCMQGGVCHPRTGECVCPEGLMGRHCGSACEKGMSGVDCSERTMNMPGSHICQPSPVPCRCVPGYTGSECRTPCAEDRWGGGCSQDCRLHCVGGCDSETGECDALGPSPCAGGDAGLPRLRQAPKVTNIGAEHATVEFSKWKEGYDDGDAALWNNLTYAVKLKTSSSTDTFTVISSKPRYVLRNLTPGTKYEVQVVLMVTATGGSLTCMADGTGRERVHRVFFTTACPEEIPAPVIVRTEKTSDTSVFVRWKPVPRPPVCPVQYHLSAIPEASGGASGPLETRNITLKETHVEVEGLEADVVYTIEVLAKSTSSSSTSPASSTSLKIYKESLGRPKTAIVVAVVLVVVSLVIVVVVWRRIRRRSVTTGIPFATEEGVPPPSPPPSQPLSSGPDESA